MKKDVFLHGSGKHFIVKIKCSKKAILTWFRCGGRGTPIHHSERHYRQLAVAKIIYRRKKNPRRSPGLLLLPAPVSPSRPRGGGVVDDDGLCGLRRPLRQPHVPPHRAHRGAVEATGGGRPTDVAAQQVGGLEEKERNSKNEGEPFARPKLSTLKEGMCAVYGCERGSRGMFNVDVSSWRPP